MEPSAARSAFGAIEREKLARSFDGSVFLAIARQVKALMLTIAACIALYAIYAGTALRQSAVVSGEFSNTGVVSPVRIARDDRGIPHIRAKSDRDMYFAEGFAQASDRLAQMDLLRRYVYGTVAEIVGPIQLPSDKAMRYLDARDVVERQWRHLSKPDRETLQAFSDGVNAAMLRQPLPFEFRVLLYQPKPWKPQDSLAVTLAICASLDDSVGNVFARDALWHKLSQHAYDTALPLSDPEYDVSFNGVHDSTHLQPSVAGSSLPASGIHQNVRGSNAWAAGAARTKNGRALLANDPHLDSSIPGIWYAVEMRSATTHVAGVTIPGIPGVVLGHNQRIAWATTNGMTSSLSVFHAPKLQARFWHREVFHVRLGRDVEKSYYRTPREFGVPADGEGSIALARWAPYTEVRSPLTTVLRLDRASNVRDALDAIADYAGPAQNFIVAGTDGAVAYHLAGPVSNDPAWGRYVHSAADLRQTYGRIAFAQLPSSSPSRTGVLISANNKMYANGYPLRLSPMFAPPYRAYRIAQLLDAHAKYDVAYFASMQLDVVSPADAEFAHRLAAYARSHPGYLPAQTSDALASWNGSFSPGSTVATLVHVLRSRVEGADTSPYAALDALREPDPNGDAMYA
ncbi:MAG: penicillin acylase family protein, partial [Candidatus Eremiobacteraeota bacterium]|nr:penicillin acylase family protein [Candidatus Eremiobacteraeota bacterium]